MWWCEVTQQIENDGFPFPQDLSAATKLSWVKVWVEGLQAIKSHYHVILRSRGKIKNLDKDSDFYSLRLLDYQVWLGGHLKWSVIRPNRAKHGTDI